MLQTHFVDGVGRQVGGGHQLQIGGVVGLAVGQAPDPRVGFRARQKLGHQSDLAVEGRIDLPFDQSGRTAVPVASQALFGGASRQAGGQARLSRLGGAQGVHLDQGFSDDEVRRDHTLAGVRAAGGGLLIHRRRHG